MTPPTRCFATDVITFYHPDFWGLDSADALRDWAFADPQAFWLRVMDASAEAGITGLELTFAPGDIDSALRAFGSAAAFRRELAARGLSVVSAFVAGGDAPTGGRTAPCPRSSPTPSDAPPSSPRWERNCSSPDCRCGRRSGRARPSSSTPRT